MGDSYKASQSQVGTMGAQVKTHGTTMTQNIGGFADVCDLKTLATELAALRQVMRGAAKEPDEDMAVADVAKAEKAAEQGDTFGVLEYLRAAGKWALHTATAIGTTLAKRL